ncbi:MAG: ABC transporter permease [Armatimonadetes bacterium]|nr:ABC transporter permease [Armatimonadota bacterium]
MRTALAALGVTIGVAAVVAVMCIGEGTKAEVLRTIESMGANLIVVTAGRTRASAGRQQQATDVETLVPADAESIAEEVPGVQWAVPVLSQKLEVKTGDSSAATTVVATLPDLPEVRNFRVSAGEFFDEDMVKKAARVAIIGQTVADTLFAGGDPLDEVIRINRVPFTIIGVMEEKGLDITGQDQDDQVFIPLTAGMRRLLNATHVNAIYVQAAGPEVMARVAAEVASLLRERHRLRDDAEDDFIVQNQADVIETRQAASSSLTLLLSSIGGISLFVGGVGILAVMLISVRERTREIGVRRAVGATQQAILVQFLVEAALLSLSGSGVGAGLGLAAAAITARLTQWGMGISYPAIVGAMAISVAIGVVFGLYPARRASLLNPIQALRAE